MKTTKIVIIGAGIAGISAGIYLKRSNTDFIIIEKDKVGGKLNILNDVENYPGTKKTTGKDILKDLISQIDYQGIEITKGSVQTILKDPYGFKVVTDIDSYLCEKVIVAIGNGTQEKNIPGEEEYFGKGVSYCAVCDGNFFKGADVAVIGNNQIAIEEAKYLSGIVNKIYMFVPGQLIKTEELKNIKNIEIIESANVESIQGTDYAVTSIVVNGKNYAISGVFCYFGEKNATQILKNLGPKFNGNYAIVDENMQSNIKGLYFAGDIVDKKLRQLITAVSDGATAAVDASR